MPTLLFKAPLMFIPIILLSACATTHPQPIQPIYPETRPLPQEVVRPTTRPQFNQQEVRPRPQTRPVSRPQARPVAYAEPMIPKVGRMAAR